MGIDAVTSPVYPYDVEELLIKDRDAQRIVGDFDLLHSLFIAQRNSSLKKERTKLQKLIERQDEKMQKNIALFFKAAYEGNVRKVESFFLAVMVILAKSKNYKFVSSIDASKPAGAIIITELINEVAGRFPEFYSLKHASIVASHLLGCELWWNYDKHEEVIYTLADDDFGSTTYHDPHDRLVFF